MHSASASGRSARPRAGGSCAWRAREPALAAANGNGQAAPGGKNTALRNIARAMIESQ